MTLINQGRTGAWLGVVILVASCAQGSTDTAGDFDPLVGTDAGEPSADAGDVDTGQSTPVGNSAGGGTAPSDEAGAAEGDGSTAGGSGADAIAADQDAGAVARDGGGDAVAAGQDAGADTGTAGQDAGADTGTAGEDGGPDSSEGTDAGPIVPTTCAEAYQDYGCCAGNDLYYCLGSNVMIEEPCTSGRVCGWSASKNYYDCVAPPGGADPGGTHPMACQ